jgi:hypothetical protein
MTELTRTVRAVLSSRFGLRLLMFVVLLIASGAYVQWRHSRMDRRAGVAEADTMCIASRIGLPCQQ